MFVDINQMWYLALFLFGVSCAVAFIKGMDL